MSKIVQHLFKLFLNFMKISVHCHCEWIKIYLTVVLIVRICLGGLRTGKGIYSLSLHRPRSQVGSDQMLSLFGLCKIADGVGLVNIRKFPMWIDTFVTETKV